MLTPWATRTAASAARSLSSGVFNELPVFEYAGLVESDRCVKDLGTACRHVGFFVLTGMPQHVCSLNDNLLTAARFFFELEEEEKERISYSRSPQFRGFMKLGKENTAGRRDEREQIEFGREEPAFDMVSTVYERLRGPNLWPTRPPELRHLVTCWMREMEMIARAVTRAISASMGLDPSALDHLFQTPHVQGKLVHYPASEGTQGVGAHTDTGFLTLLLQDSVGGLEVQNNDGHWVPATPLPGSLICNLGEMLQLITNGEYVSTVHRVTQPSENRISAPYFWNPSLNAHVEPLLPMAEPTSSINRLIPQYGMNAFKSLARSHPEVFSQHHPDLRCLPDGSVVRRDCVL
uniref:Fe2OG dioxygenase domain-containing protein n=1 Tax=Noctiluca scintillans TaxID=2966 RepID=A0A7S1B101_NOCSC|mmetsp:Transcript_7935/g.21893  ORF Transcript_7935/g.21893 Transcript_7935/m.21893 type:complete len:349 (+) Transcript_7935:56-1102(+)